MTIIWLNRAITRADNDIQFAPNEARQNRMVVNTTRDKSCAGHTETGGGVTPRRCANSVAFPSQRRTSGASSPCSDAPLTYFDSRLSMFLPFPPSCSDQGADNWPGDVHRARLPALSHHAQGIDA